MALRRRIQWLKYLYPGQTGLQYEQNYHKLKRHEHQVGEHTKGIVSGLGVTQTAPLSLLVNVAAGRAIDSVGQEVEIESTQQVDLTSLVPGAGTQTVYITLVYVEVQSDPYLVEELGANQNRYVSDSYTLQATTTAPTDPTLELARVEVAAGAAQIVHASDPDSPGNNEIDMSNRIGSVVIGLPTNCIGGLITSNGTDDDHDIDIAKGVCRDDQDIDDMRLSLVLTKQIDDLWEVGSDKGGLDGGLVAASTLYAVWLIKRSDTGVVDALFSTSFTAPNLPTNYDKKRLIAAVYTDASFNILAYTQSGDYFRYMGDIVEDVHVDITSAGTFETGTLSAPPNCLAHIYGHLFSVNETNHWGYLFVRPYAANDSGSSVLEAFAAIAMDVDFRKVTTIGMVLVDSSRRIEYTCTEGAVPAAVRIRTLGFTMLTRREP